MSVKVATRVTINATPKEVFGYLNNLKYHYLWNPQIRTIKPEIILKKPGDSYQTTSVVLGKRLSATNMVTKLVENRELELENTTGMVHYQATIRLNQKEGKTLVICTTVVEPIALGFAFAKPVLQILARRELQSDMQALKLAVEHKLKP